MTEQNSIKFQTELYPETIREIESKKKKIENSDKICPENKKTIQKFFVKLQADGSSFAHQMSHLNTLHQIGELVGNTQFKDVTRPQMEEVFAKWRNSGYRRHRSAKLRQYKQGTVNKNIECLKLFYKWIF